MIHGSTFDRAKRILLARGKSPNSLAAAEHEVSVTMLGPEVLEADARVHKACFPQYGYMSPFGSTRVLAEELRRALAWYASNVGLKEPTHAKYNPLYCTPKTFGEVWRLRQAIDDLGISYWFYIEHAVFYWATKRRKTPKRRNRMPRPEQLFDPEIVEYVLDLWSDPAFRINVPLFNDWDPRFGADMFEGNEKQLAARALIDQRLEDAKAVRRNPAQELHKFLGDVISEHDARERYGSAMVDEALACDPNTDLAGLVLNDDASDKPAD